MTTPNRLKAALRESDRSLAEFSPSEFRFAMNTVPSHSVAVKMPGILNPLDRLWVYLGHIVGMRPGQVFVIPCHCRVKGRHPYRKEDIMRVELVSHRLHQEKGLYWVRACHCRKVFWGFTDV